MISYRSWASSTSDSFIANVKIHLAVLIRPRQSSQYFGKSVAFIPVAALNRSFTVLWSYQVISGHGNPPKKGGQCLAVIYSNIVALNIRLFTMYLRRHPSKKINTKKVPEKLFR